MPRVFTAHTPLGAALQFHTLRGTEEMSRCFDFELTLVSPDHSIATSAILGQPVTVEIEREDRSKRYLSGHVIEFGQVDRDGRLSVYRARLKPQFWYLTQTRDYRIWQHMTARDIAKQVFSEFGIVIKDKLTGYYRMRDYCVQYGESYFDFVSRLFEEEGVSYYYEHSMGQHVLVLCDSLSAYPTLPSHASIPYYPPDMAGIPDQEHISAWHASQRIQPGKYVSTDYDFKKPKANLELRQPMPRPHPNAAHEVFDFPGRYREVGDGDNYARIRIETLQYQHERAEARSNVRGLMPGHRFSPTRCPRKSENRENLITHCTYHFEDNSYEGGQQSKVVIHDTAFTAMPSTEPFRPERLTPYPQTNGPDSAIVTGPAGQEIWTDAHGRVPVHFHWDRRGAKDQNSSCWVRIAQPWAGSNFGMIHIPRIGQEVLVEYVNGNPDHPVITSRVYNADNMPPWDLPANATQSGILTRSSKGGGYDNANALRFEDKKGEEQLWLHAEKDQLTEVEHDEDKWVGNDRRKTIDRDETNHIKRDRSETVDRDETITVHGKRTEVVDGNEDITIHSNRKERVDQNETISVGQNRDEDVGASETVKIANNRSKKVGNDEDIDIGSNLSIKVGSTETETIGMACVQSVGMAKMTNVGMVHSINVGMMINTLVGVQQSEQVGKNKSISVGENFETKTGKNHKFEVGEQFEIVCGDAKLVLKSDGGIYLQGKHIEINGGNLLNAEAKLVQINTASAEAPPEAKTASDAPPGAAAGGAGGLNGALGGLSGALGSLGGAVGQIAGAVKQAQGIIGAVKSIGSGGLGGVAGAIGGLGGLGGLGGGSGGKGGGSLPGGGGIPGGTPGWAGPIAM